MGRRSVTLSLSVCVALALGSQIAGAAESGGDCTAFHINSKASHGLTKASSTNHCVVSTHGGYPIPDPKCTPGAVNPTLTANVLKNVNFRTSCVRNDATSESQKSGTYEAYSVPHPENNRGVMQTCELDHLISLELGGADTLDNIWPQCGPSGVVLTERYFKEKDMVENYLAAKVRKGEMDLSDAQQGIAKNWPQYLEDARNACRTGTCK